ncbi:cbb3-type cytochrome c oxidase subunit 3 [Gemmobacter fulvus]|uniref:Cbb3-type cytochrome c oxidase subunit 3 n=1 Tax=Gemmobacter fulvus TaxID=2840474 RepID=A0A975P7A7_9RHOB|nr:cbb3-type cytochrome c oxidase subunit 3 [Gemmobacter fulvus]MBT9246936.1 cbb3-type cytochrome c oxidase subunit 3 [Gemmobacter fulvus]MDQ1847355.1 cbb3-type cytochrome c oxidase subunit 3 [Gemmobacter fulvus]QWK89711.1 cbb3-type cytochrome c oxidase subunit 3 [Gemmobacter fulvus]
MDTYSFLRHFADSWMLLLMTALFVGIVVFAFRPGSRSVQDDAANSIFRNEKRPARDPAEAPVRRNSKEA